MQLDVPARTPGQEPPAPTLTLTSSGRPLAVADHEWHPALYQPLERLLQAVAAAAQRRQQVENPARRRPGDQPELAGLIETYLRSIS